ncbi:MAG: TolC family protein [Acidobacteriota bacterium]
MRHVPSRGSLVLFVLFSAAAAAPNPSPAQEPPAEPMGIEACVQEALRANPLLEAAGHGLLAAREAESAARSAYLPRLDFQAASRRFESRAFLPSALTGEAAPAGGISPVIGPVNQHSLAMKGTYTLFDGGLRRAEAAHAAAGTWGALHAREEARQKVVLSVHKAFYGALAAQESLGVAEKVLERALQHERMALARRETGDAPLADVLRARVRTSEARVALLRASSDVSVAMGALNAAMGRPPQTPLSIRHDPRTPADAPLPSVGEALAAALSERPELDGAVQRVEAGRRRVEAARSAFVPKVRLEGSYGRLDQGFFPGDRDWSLGIALAVPVFTGFARGHDLARARAELARSESEALWVVLAVEQEAFAALARAEESRAAVLAVRDLVREAEESLRMARERYAEGAGTITDLLDAETGLSEARLREVRAVYEERMAAAELRWATGRADGETSGTGER